MSTPNKIIIIVVIILIVVGAFWLVRRENQFRACLDKCDEFWGSSKRTCEAECREKYGKPIDKKPTYDIPQQPQPSDLVTQEECQTAGYYWYDEACHTDPPASYLVTQEECETAGYYWYDEACHTDPQTKINL